MSITEPYVLDETREAEIAAQVAARFGHRWGDPPVEIETPEPQDAGTATPAGSLPDGAAQVQAAGDGGGGTSSSPTAPAPPIVPAAAAPAPTVDPADPALGLTPTITSPADAPASALPVDPNATPVDPSAVFGASGAPGTSSPPDDGAAPLSSGGASSPTDTLDLNAFIQRAYGDVNPNDVLSVFNFYDTVVASPPPVQQAISALLAGDVESVARALGITPSVPAVPAAPTASVTTPAAPPAPPIEAYDAWGQPITIPAPTAPATPAVDPELAARLERLEADRAAEQQRAYAAEIARAQAQANEGLAEFRTKYASLDATDLMLLQRQVNARGNIDMVNSKAIGYGGDYKRAYYEALDAFAWSDPTIRAKLNEAEIAATQAQVVADQQRQTRASALAGGGGVPSAVAASVHAPPAAPPTPTPRNPAAPTANRSRPLRDPALTEQIAAEVRAAAGLPK